MNAPQIFEQLDEFLAVVSNESPCGSNLAGEGDEEYLRIEREVERATEVRDWGALKKDITPLLYKTKDFRLLAFYGRASISSEKSPLSELTNILLVAKGYIQNNWDCVFPLEDAEDEDDKFTDRLNAIGELGAWGTIVLPLKKKRALLDFKGMQEYSLNDLLSFQRGEKIEGKQSPSQFVKALTKEEIGQIESILVSAKQAYEAGNEVKNLVAGKVGESFVEFDKYLFPLLQDVITVLTDLVSESSHVSIVDELDDELNKIFPKSDIDRKTEGAKVLSVNTRDDVVVVLDLICDYYNKHEPSSPLPLLLKRARGIVHKDFLEVLEELVPDSVSMTESVFGRKDEEND